MTKPIISVENLSKAYRLGHKEEVPDTLVGAATSVLKAPFRNFKRLSSMDLKDGGEADDILWALKDVSFDVHEGEVVGIIGRNGAGKSTLLKILSRITEPTSGCVKLRGRVSSLLEVGTGFHPELTGRDNVYMNGTILGMKKREIDKKFDEIVDFSGVEKFLDTPVKRYSSGMLVRLAFAVAAHLEPEILIVDEVLAVGDAEFQKKCLGKMQDVSRTGRTVLFVSHNMSAVERLCNRGVLLRNGCVCDAGLSGTVIKQYLESVEPSSTGGDLKNHPRRENTMACAMNKVTIKSGGEETDSIRVSDPLEVHVSFDSKIELTPPVLGVVFKDNIGTSLFGMNNRISPDNGSVKHCHSGTIVCAYRSIPLLPGRYSIDLYLGDSQRDIDIVESAVNFNVHEADVFGTGRLPPQGCGPFVNHAVFNIIKKT